jgi:rare lipoprotein A
MKSFKQFVAEAMPFAEIVPTSSYGPGFFGRRTASGSILTPQSSGIASPNLPLGSRVRLTDPKTKKSVEVPVIDRGPYVGNRKADLTTKAAQQLGYKDSNAYGVRNIDVTPVAAKPIQQKPKKPPIIGLPD